MRAFIEASAVALGLPAPDADASEKKAAPTEGGPEAENQRVDTPNFAPLTGASQDATRLGITSSRSVPTPVIDRDAEKQLAGIAARLARKGWTLHALRDGAYLVGRWGYTRQVADLRDLEAFLRQIGGAHA
jgi:hypothetical protein